MKKYQLYFVLIFIFISQQLLAQNFITKWDLSQPGGDGNDSIGFNATTTTGASYTWQQLPTGASGSGTIPGGTQFTTIAGMPSNAMIRLEINPTNLQRFFINNTDDKLRLIDITQWGTVAWSNMTTAFKGCSNLQITAIDVPNFAAVTSMSSMFFECTILNGPSNINTWNTAAVTDMNNMFYFASAFNQPIGNWNTASVTNMSNMFSDATAFNQPIGNWNMASATNTEYMFVRAAAFNQSINNWNTSAVTTMIGMFSEASAFDQPLNSWNTAAVTEMQEMFYAASTFNQPIGNWNTSAVTNMNTMFSNASSFNQPINNWNTASVTNMNSMFYGANSFDQPLKNWNTGAVTTMSSMFYAANTFNQPLSNWNTSSVSDMSYMFENATAFNQPLGSWDVSQVTNLSSMLRNTAFNQRLNGWLLRPAGVFMFNIFQGSAMSCGNYSASLIGWNANASCPSNVGLGNITGMQYSAAATTARTNLISVKNWFISGDSSSGAVTTEPTFTAVSPILCGDTLAALPTTSTNGITGVWSPAINNVETTTYIFRAVPANCSPNVSMTIVVGGTTTWNGSSWSPNVPNSSSKAVFSGNYSQPTDLTACSINVIGNAVVTVPSGFDFTVNYKIDVAPTARLTFENNANLLQDVTAINTGNVLFKRNTSLQRLAYTMWSSPVANQNALAFSPLTVDTRFYTYNETNNTFTTVASPSNIILTPAVGYAVRAPNTYAASSTSAFVGTFTGTPNNGTFTYAGSKVANGYNLIGNPYPSTILVSAFLAANPNVNALYFWDNANIGAPGNRYATRNAGAGTASAISPSKTPTNFIAPGQGFYVEITSATNTNVVFTNAMRSSDNSAAVFFRNAASNKSLFKLNLVGTSNTFNQIAIGYMQGATNGIDNQIDAVPFAQSSTMVSSLINNVDYVIQGRGLPFANTDVVPLGFKTDVAGNYSFNTEAFEGVFANNQDVFLKDNLVGTTHNIKQNPYLFTTNVGTFNNRFQIVYQATLGTNNPTFNANNVFVFVKNDNININSGSTNIKNIQVFDIQGRLVFDKKEVNATQFEIENLKVAQAVLVLKITSEDGAVVTKKIVY